MTVLEAIQKSTDFLAKKGVDSPRLQSELLLAHVLETPRLKLYLDFTRRLDEEQAGSFRELIKRRGNREPLQHILGSTSFCGLEITVNNSVLVPRPETELLAEEGWKHLNSLGGRPGSFLDFGTGSGCIALALCHFAANARGWALDKSDEALKMARFNIEKHQLANRLSFVQSNAFENLDPALRFDLIISNPPYIPSKDLPSLQDEVRKFDPPSALDGGPDGLDFYRLLAAEVPRHLAAGGKLMLEFGDGQEKWIPGILESHGWIMELVLNDYSSRPRVGVAKRASGMEMN
ncbi:MAG TPA: peptide chain release factor N(5)-glutamine methyltransferase [Verrucomicrobiae bacterium]|jgi:release factor glutamine methyltransferase|nr:peptide chain release factor N(5)-glutamine methyltransferase [Verrucomicrobiae bacterium]